MRPALLIALAAACSSPPAKPAPAPPPRPAPPLVATSEPLDGAAQDATQEGVPPAPAADAGTAAERDAPGARRLLGRVAGIPIAPEDLLLEWQAFDSRQLWLSLEKLIATRLAFAEAQRLGIRLQPDAVDARSASERRRAEEELERANPGKSAAEVIEVELGQDPERYFDRLREGIVRQLLAERAVRAWTLSNEHVAIRLIVVPEGEMEGVRARLAAGEEFAALAREASVDDSAEDGGWVPFVVRQELSPLARLAFATPIGEVGGPIPASGHEVLIRVEERAEPLDGDWSALRAPVEKSLAEEPVREGEFLHWKLAMERRYPVDLSPLVDLLGLARR